MLIKRNNLILAIILILFAYTPLPSQAVRDRGTCVNSNATCLINSNNFLCPSGSIRICSTMNNNSKPICFNQMTQAVNFGDCLGFSELPPEKESTCINGNATCNDGTTFNCNDGEIKLCSTNNNGSEPLCFHSSEGRVVNGSCSSSICNIPKNGSLTIQRTSNSVLSGPITFAMSNLLQQQIDGINVLETYKTQSPIFLDALNYYHVYINILEGDFPPIAFFEKNGSEIIGSFPIEAACGYKTSTSIIERPPSGSSISLLVNVNWVNELDESPGTTNPILGCEPESVFADITINGIANGLRVNQPLTRKSPDSNIYETETFKDNLSRDYRITYTFNNTGDPNETGALSIHYPNGSISTGNIEKSCSNRTEEVGNSSIGLSRITIFHKQVTSTANSPGSSSGGNTGSTSSCNEFSSIDLAIETGNNTPKTINLPISELNIEETRANQEVVSRVFSTDEFTDQLNRRYSIRLSKHKDGLESLSIHYEDGGTSTASILQQNKVNCKFENTIIRDEFSNFNVKLNYSETKPPLKSPPGTFSRKIKMCIPSSGTINYSAALPGTSINNSNIVFEEVDLTNPTNRAYFTEEVSRAFRARFTDGPLANNPSTSFAGIEFIINKEKDMLVWLHDGGGIGGKSIRQLTSERCNDTPISFSSSDNTLTINYQQLPDDYIQLSH